jgi:hypothetical protein
LGEYRGWHRYEQEPAAQKAEKLIRSKFERRLRLLHDFGIPARAAKLSRTQLMSGIRINLQRFFIPGETIETKISFGEPKSKAPEE